MKALHGKHCQRCASKVRRCVDYCFRTFIISIYLYLVLKVVFHFKTCNFTYPPPLSPRPPLRIFSWKCTLPKVIKRARNLCGDCVCRCKFWKEDWVFTLRINERNLAISTRRDTINRCQSLKYYYNLSTLILSSALPVGVPFVFTTTPTFSKRHFLTVFSKKISSFFFHIFIFAFSTQTMQCYKCHKQHEHRKKSSQVGGWYQAACFCEG